MASSPASSPPFFALLVRPLGFLSSAPSARPCVYTEICAAALWFSSRSAARRAARRAGLLRCSEVVLADLVADVSDYG